MEFKENLKRIIETKKITPKYIYENLKISKANYYGMLKNNNPTYTTIQKLKIILDCSYDELLK